MRNKSFKTSPRYQVLATVCGLCAGLLAAAIVLHWNGGDLIVPLTVSARDCNLKSEIHSTDLGKSWSISDNRRDKTRSIRSENGERWFCADRDALAANWQPAEP